MGYLLFMYCLSNLIKNPFKTNNLYQHIFEMICIFIVLNILMENILLLFKILQEKLKEKFIFAYFSFILKTTKSFFCFNSFQMYLQYRKIHFVSKYWLAK